jgi:hypothetical protein
MGLTISHRSVKHVVWLTSDPTWVRIHDDGLLFLLLLPMFVKNFLTLSTLLGGWLHERGPAEYNIRRNDKIFETN